MTMFFTQIYVYDNNENIYMLILKKNFKNVYAFFIKLLATSKQLFRRNSICCLKNQVIFHWVNIEIGLNPPPPTLFVFICSLKTPLLPPRQTHGFPQVLRTWGELKLLFIVLFLGIISWKGTSRFSGGRGCFSDGRRASFLSRGRMGRYQFWWGVQKKLLDGRRTCPLMPPPPPPH